jgi:hypothetical protein
VVICARSVGLAPCAACAVLARAEAGRALGGEEAEVAELEAYRARGLFGRLAGRAGARGGAGEGRPGELSGGEAAARLGAGERDALARRFRCPDCGGRALAFGERIARHRCADGPDRPVAWRGYDGTLVELGWWSRG